MWFRCIDITSAAGFKMFLKKTVSHYNLQIFTLHLYKSFEENMFYVIMQWNSTIHSELKSFKLWLSKHKLSYTKVNKS